MRTLTALALGLVTLLLGCSRSAVRTHAPETSTALPPPQRPEDVLAEVHFGQPRASVTTLGTMLGTRLPFELGLSLALGIDSTILAATDTSKPMDVVILGRERPTDALLVLTPGASNTLRNTLSARYRLTPIAGLGERLDPRTPQGRRNHGPHCAIIGVQSTIPSRIVCANRFEALARAGRYAAHLSQRRADDSTDALVEIDGSVARTALLPTLRRAIEDLARGLAQSAAEQRRVHTRPPDFGDPEALVAMLTRFARNLDTHTEDIRNITARTTIAPERAILEIDVSLDAQGHSVLVRDALARTERTGEHPLASRIPPDSFAVVASYASADRHATLVRGTIDSVIEVLGHRIPDPSAARRDLETLFAHIGQAVVIGTAREPTGGIEQTALFALTDRGTETRTALARLAQATWLRSMRLGESPLVVTWRNGTLSLRLDTPRTRHARRAVDSEMQPTASPRSLAISIVGDTLALIIGSRPEASLSALTLRNDGPVMPLLAQVPGASFVAAIDLAALQRRTGESAVLHLTYGASRHENRLISHGQLVLPGRWIASVLRGVASLMFGQE